MIEVMVALTLFGLIATVHTVATMRFGLRTRLSAVQSSRSAALSSAVQLYSTMPRASIASNLGCTTISTLEGYAHQRCVTTTVVTGTTNRIRIIIRPTNIAFRADTLWVDRVTSAATPVFQ